MKKIPLTQGKVALVDDDHYVLLSQHKWYARKVSKPSGRVQYYAARTVEVNGTKTTVYMHREIVKPAFGQEVDHINHNGLDNRRQNLRYASRKQNSRNAVKSRGKLSRFKGVSFDRGRGQWMAYIRVDGKQRTLGRFDSEIEAARAYDAAALTYFGEFAHLNINDGVAA